MFLLTKEMNIHRSSKCSYIYTLTTRIEEPHNLEFTTTTRNIWSNNVVFLIIINVKLPAHSSNESSMSLI